MTPAASDGWKYQVQLGYRWSGASTCLVMVYVTRLRGGKEEGWETENLTDSGWVPYQGYDLLAPMLEAQLEDGKDHQELLFTP